MVRWRDLKQSSVRPVQSPMVFDVPPLSVQSPLSYKLNSSLHLYIAASMCAGLFCGLRRPPRLAASVDSQSDRGRTWMNASVSNITTTLLHMAP